MRPNTPTKRQSTSKVWITVRRLSESHTSFKTHTHICHEAVECAPGVFRFCNQLLKLHKTIAVEAAQLFKHKSSEKSNDNSSLAVCTSSCSTSGAVDHLRIHEKNCVGLKSLKNEGMRDAKRLEDMFDFTRGATIAQQKTVTGIAKSNPFAMSLKVQALTA